jgi:hypothetical protein
MKVFQIKQIGADEDDYWFTRIDCH